MKFSDKGNGAFVVGETRKFGAPKLRCNTPTFATGEATGTGQLQVEAAFVRRPVFPATTVLPYTSNLNHRPCGIIQLYYVFVAM